MIHEDNKWRYLAVSVCLYSLVFFIITGNDTFLVISGSVGFGLGCGEKSSMH